MNKQLSKYHILLIYAILTLVTFIAFEQIRNNDFIWYDDEEYIIHNPHVNNGISLESVGWAFTTSHGGNWHPLTWISHMIDCEFFGLNPSGHHVVNMLIHTASALLLFAALKKMTGAVWPSVFVALLFAIHPLRVESVAWAAERKDTLSGFFWMLTLLAYASYAKQVCVKKYLLVVLFFVLGLMSKAMLVTLPFALLLLDYWPLKRMQLFEKNHLKTTSVLYLITEKIPLFLITIVSCITTFFVEQNIGSMELSKVLPFNLRMANALVSYRDYIFKMVYPARLAILYPLHSKTLNPSTAVLLLAGISILVIFLFRRRYLTVGWLWYLGTFVPVIGLIQLGSQSMADRYTYLPSIGFFIMITWGVSDLLTKWRYRKIILSITSALILIALLVCTRMQVSHWQNEASLYKHATETTKDNYLMHYFYGWVLQEDLGKLEEAIKHFDEAIRINPNYIDCHNRKGVTLLSLQRYEQAAVSFEEVLRLKPDHVQAISRLGSALERMGKYESAIQNYKKAVELKPDYFYAHRKLAAALVAQNRPDEAIKHLNDTLQSRPDLSELYNYLGDIYGQLNKYDLAIQSYSKALAAKPDLPMTHFKLATIYHKQGKLELVINHCTEALRLEPLLHEARVNLANVLFRVGRIEDGINQYYKVLETNPGEVETINTLNNLAWILATTEDMKLQNPVEAIKLSEQACELTKYNRADLLDTLAIAYAAAGKFEQAIETAEKAISLAKSENKKSMASVIQKRLELYKANKPYLKP